MQKTAYPWIIKLPHLRSSMVQFELSNGWKKRSGTPKGLGRLDLWNMINMSIKDIYGVSDVYIDTCVGIWPGGEIRWEGLRRRAAKGARRPFLCLGGGDYADIEDNSKRRNKVMFSPLDVRLVNSSSLPWASKTFSWKWDEGFINLVITNQCMSRLATFTVTDVGL